MRGLWGLVWLEIKIFVREPLGLFGTVVAPAVLFVALGRMLSGRAESSARAMTFVASDVPVFVALFIAISAVMSLVTVIAVYRESGILKRLRATPLRPHTILTAHVIVKLVFSGLALGLMAAAGRRLYPVALDVPWLGFALALVVSLVSIVSMGFLIASLVPTARFAQPVGTVLLYPMLGISGLFVPVESLPAALQAVARVMPMTYAVSLLRGAWAGEPWSAHLLDLAALGVVFVVCTALTTRVFRWE
jgi:ABC-2 type transport system permease protein